MFFYTSFKHTKTLEEMFSSLIKVLDTRIAECVLYINKIKPAEITEEPEQENEKEGEESEKQVIVTDLTKFIKD